MLKRYKIQASHFLPSMRLRPAGALRDRIREGYGMRDFQADLMAGLVVGLVAIPLGMALAIASGVAPQYGLYTVIIGGGIVALLGGSRFQVTGPTAAFVVVLAPIVQKFGFGGLLLAGFMAGLMLILMGLARMGRLIQFIPYPVTTGFTSGIALVIATLQLKDFLGLQVSEMPERFPGKVFALAAAVDSVSWPELSLGLFTLMFLIFWPRLNKRIPAPLVALFTASCLAFALRSIFPNLEIATIGSRFSFDLGGVVGQGIPQLPPMLDWPWNFAGAVGPKFQFSFEAVEAIVPGAFAIAMLGAIESLLSAVVADGMSQTKHDPDTELVALGVGNLICPFFGGVPATGAIARTATNIRFGARSPIAAVVHALFTLLVVLLFAPMMAHLPMAALAALLMLVAYNMAELTHFRQILKVAPASDVVVLLICFFLTLMFDMVVGVMVGVVLAALLFMRRMAEVTDGHRVERRAFPRPSGKNIPDDIVLYEIEGPLFFGAAEKAAETLADITDNINGVIFLMKEVPVMDMTGLVALEAAVRKLCKRKRKVALVGLRAQPRELISRSGMAGGQVAMFETLDDALAELSGEGGEL
jgi:sulfate permease, SulP family